MVELPAVKVCEDGDTLTEKSGGGTWGTICIPFTGARWKLSEAVLGIAVSVKPVAVTKKTT